VYSSLAHGIFDEEEALSLGVVAHSHNVHHVVILEETEEISKGTHKGIVTEGG
jgi:hypothetical protein